MEFRLWIGLHSALQCLILVATDASFIIKYITRFTEEGFSTLISFIFIYDAIKKMIGAFKYYPINSDFKPDYVTMYKCECVAPDPGEFIPGPPGQEPGVGGRVPAWMNPMDRWPRMWQEAAAWGGETSSSSSSSEGGWKMEEEPCPPRMKDLVLPRTQRTGSWDVSLEQPDLDG